ncbi:MAG TPA: hypothetical protein VGY54_21695, partial [Polyangiaceae bacterium]|nr:hypothetical protein [Polyangiaceae bacterium]
MKRPKLARDPRYFSPGGYRRLIQRALRLGYRISGFRNFRALGRRPVLLLRHDLDHSIRAAAIIAEIEAELGVSSTYFVQVACPFYNLLSNESRKLIEHIVQLGHEIGLHYEAPRYEGPGGEYKLGGDLRLLRDLSGQRVSSASQHVPV